MVPDPLQHWHHAERLAANGAMVVAADAYRSLLAFPAWAMPAHLRLSVLSANMGEVRSATAHALAAGALAVDEEDAALVEGACAQLMAMGELEAGLACARLPVLADSSDAGLLLAVGALLADVSFTAESLAFFDRAHALGLDSAELHYRRGLAQLYAGDSAGAEASLAASLERAPRSLRALRARSRLRRATPARHHLEDLHRVAAQTADEDPEAPLLHYTLFKELDELGETAAAWAALERGMRLRRGQVRYDAAAEDALFQALHEVRPVAEGEGATTDGPVPIFIVGMPRSGTTLLERMLGAHPQVADAGELRDFTTQMRWLTNRMGGPHPDLALAQAATTVDVAALGARYLAHTQWRAGGRSHYTDKLPTNFLNVGWIARALPQARILHMARAPVDSCFSNLKELFAEAYPHSYDQHDMADHYRRYHALMAHWHQAFPGRLLDVHYERLVREPQAVAREVLAFCGLPWTDGVLAPEERRGAVATASAVQVREAIHPRFVGQWRRYADQLAPLIARLGALAGPELDRPG